MVIDGISITGSYHQSNQDSFLCSTLDEGFVIAISDGLGSLRDSKAGSQALCNCVVEHAKELKHKLLSISPQEFVTQVHKLWLQSLEAKDPSQCYATMLFVIAYQERVFAGQLGDGFIGLWLDDVFTLIRDDKDINFINETDCLTENLDMSLFVFVDTKISTIHGVVLSTDGFELDDMSFESLKEFTKEFIVGYRQLNQVSVAKHVLSWLEQWPGCDDKTIAYAINSED